MPFARRRLRPRNTPRLSRITIGRPTDDRLVGGTQLVAGFVQDWATKIVTYEQRSSFNMTRYVRFAIGLVRGLPSVGISSPMHDAVGPLSQLAYHTLPESV